MIVEIKQDDLKNGLRKGEWYLAKTYTDGKVELLHRIVKKRKEIAEYKYNVKVINI